MQHYAHHVNHNRLYIFIIILVFLFALQITILIRHYKLVHNVIPHAKIVADTDQMLAVVVTDHYTYPNPNV